MYIQSYCYRMVHWLRRNTWKLHLKWKRKGKGFNFDLGVNRLKGRLGKCRRTGFGLGKFVGGFDIGVIKLGDSVICSCV